MAASRNCPAIAQYSGGWLWLLGTVCSYKIAERPVIARFSCSRTQSEKAAKRSHFLYKGTSGVMSDLVGNHVSAMFVPTHVALPLAADRQIRILGVASPQRVAAAPDVPTLAEQGVTGFDVDIWFGLLAPTGTAPDVIARYNAVINEFLRSPAVTGALAKQGLITAGGPPEVLATLIAHDMAKWQKVIQQAGITAE
jgi:tripartite-type tricarboxylate transporter receptor subunit TctC